MARLPLRELLERRRPEAALAIITKTKMTTIVSVVMTTRRSLSETYWPASQIAAIAMTAPAASRACRRGRLITELRRSIGMSNRTSYVPAREAALFVVASIQSLVRTVHAQPTFHQAVKNADVLER